MTVETWIPQDFINDVARRSDSNCALMAKKFENNGVGVVDRLRLKMTPWLFDEDFKNDPAVYIASGWKMLSEAKSEADKEMLSRVFERHIDDIAKQIPRANDEVQKLGFIELFARTSAVYDLIGLWRVGDEKLKEKVANALDNKFDFINDKAGIPNNIWESMWEFKLDRANKKDYLGLLYREKMGEEISEPDGLGLNGLMNRCLPESLREVSAEQLESKLTLMATVTGVPDRYSGDVVRSWLTLDKEGLAKDGLDYEKELRRIVADNLKTVMELRFLAGENGKEVVGDLYKLYGITHFGRYGSEILWQQWQNRNDTSKEYGVWVGPYHDWNNAFHLESKSAVSGLVKSANELGILVRIVEARGKESVARRLMVLDKVYGESQKIAFMVINGHGQPSNVRLGDYMDDKNHDYELTIDDLQSKGARRVRGFYKDEMPIVFVSCSTGKKEGIAQKYSVYTGGHTTAPELSVNITSLALARNRDGRLLFKDVKYEFGGTGRYAAGLDLKEEEARLVREKVDKMVASAETNEGLKEVMWTGDGVVLGTILTERILPPIWGDVEDRFSGDNIGVAWESVRVPMAMDKVIGSIDDLQYFDKAKLKQLMSYREDGLMDNFGFAGAKRDTLTDRAHLSLAESAVRCCKESYRTWKRYRDTYTMLPLIKVYAKDGSGWVLKGGYLIDQRRLYPESK